MADLEDVTLDGRPLQSLRVADLKAALEERGLSKSGQKNALIKRLKGALMLENLQRTSTAHIGLQPNSQIGEEMSQNSFIKQYLAKQQELLRQRLEREAREAYETNEQEDHKDVNNSTSCPPPAQDVTPSGQHKPPGPSEGEGLFGSVNAGQDNRNQEADVSSPPASGSVAMRVPGGEQRSERGSASSEVAGDSDDEDSEGGDDDDWGGGAPRRNLREPPRVPAVRERAGAPRQPQQQHIPSLLSPQLRQPTPPPSPPPELSFPLPDTPKQSPPSPPAAPARHSPSSSSSGSSSSGSRSSSPEPQRSGHVERKPGPLSLLVRKMESEEAYSGPGWHGTDGEGDRQDSSSPSAMLFPGRGPPGGLVSAISHTANTASHVPFPMIPHTHQGVTHLAPSQLPVSVLKATAAEERDRERESELERERALELERQEKLRQLEEERAAEEAKQRAIALEREERERALERERFERQQALEREEREKALQREQELALERERREREEALAREREERERAMELERQKELERQRALEEERLRREREEKEKREREEMEKALEQERIKRERALEQERLERERALEAERREKERIEREKALEQERLEKERIEREKALELARIEKEKAMEKERIEKERALEQERIEREKAAELERIEREKALEQERIEREKALEQEKLELERKEKERIEREKALEQERIERERREREEKEKAEKAAALEKERMERERAEKERKEQMEREKALEQEKLEKAKAQEKERKEKERALEQEKERALKQERMEREKAVQKEKEELEKEKLKMAETEIGIHLPPSKRSHELNLTSQSKPSVLSAQKALGDAKQEDIHAPASQSEAQTSESNAAPQSPHSSFKKFRFLRESPVQAQPSSTSLVIKRPRTFSDSPQPRTLHVISPTTAGDRQQSTTEQEHPQVPKSLEVSAATAGSAETQSEKTAAPDQSSKEEAREQAVSPQTEESFKESIISAKELDERKDSSSPVDASEQRGRDAKKNEKRSRRRSSSNDSSSSESDSGSSSSQSSGSSTSSQDKTRTSSRRRDEEKCKRDSSPLRVETAEADTEAVKRSPQASHREKETPTERSNTAAGDVHTMKQVTEDRAREDPHRKRKCSEGDEEKEKQRRVTEKVMADPEKLSETSEETPKAFSARKISLGSSKSSPGTGSGEGEQESGPVAGRKRRWGSSTAVTAKKPSISITTDSLKSLIPDIRPTLAQEPVVDLHPEEAVLSGGEDEDQERPDQNLQIRRTVTQVVHAEENGQKEAKRSRSEELEEDDSQGDREIMKSPEEQMDASLPVETQSPTHTSQDAEINTVTPSETLIRRSISQQKTGVSITIDDPVRTARQPSPPRGKVSNIVHICNLVRPFTLGQLKELLSRTGTLVEDGFWIDKIKSHCYVTYASLEEAVATRGALHGVKWPQSNPKVLRVDFCEQDELDFHKGLGAAEKPGGEEAGPPSGRGRTSGLPSLLPERNQWAEREREMERRERARAEREWDRDKVKEFGKPAEEKDGGPRRSRSRERRRKERGKSKEKKTEKKSEDPPAKLLDDLFLKTKAAPCIYWLPLTEEQYVQRQAALAEQKKEREERRKEREKQRKEQEEEEEKKREEERKERMKAAGATTGDRSEGEKDKDRDRERDRDRGRDRDRDRDRERDREREREKERENDKRRDGYRRPGGSSARRSRSRSEPRERRR